MSTRRTLGVHILTCLSGSKDGVLASAVPLLAPSLAPGTIYDWNYTTTPQPGFNNRAMPYPRGKILGGSTSISAVFNFLLSLFIDSCSYFRLYGLFQRLFGRLQQVCFGDARSRMELD